MQWLLDFVNGFASILYNSLSWVLDGLWLLFGDILYAILDQLLDAVVTVVSLLDVSSLAVNVASGWGLLPPQLVWIINQSGLATGISMLANAYALRFALNLIPAAFTRV